MPCPFSHSFICFVFAFLFRFLFHFPSSFLLYVYSYTRCLYFIALNIFSAFSLGNLFRKSISFFVSVSLLFTQISIHVLSFHSFLFLLLGFYFTYFLFFDCCFSFSSYFFLPLYLLFHLFTFLRFFQTLNSSSFESLCLFYFSKSIPFAL